MATSRLGLILSILLLGGALGANSVCAEPRTWTDERGRKIEAEFLRSEAGTVYLLLGGREVRYPLAKLSRADQLYVTEQVAKGVSRPTPRGDSAESNTATGAGAARSNPSGAGNRSSGDANPFRPDGETPSNSRSRTSSKPPSQRHAPGELRTWTDTEGNHKRARFVRVHESRVILSSGSRTIPIDFAKLSADDQQYVREVLEERGEGHLAPALTTYDFGDPTTDEEEKPDSPAGGARPGGATHVASAPSVSSRMGGGSSYPRPPFAGRGSIGPRGGPMGRGPTGLRQQTTTRSTTTANAANVNNPYAPDAQSAAAAAHAAGGNSAQSSFPGGTAFPSGAGGGNSSGYGGSSGPDPMRERMRAIASAAPIHRGAEQPQAPVATEMMVYMCSNCNSEVSSGSAGDKCPHCGVRWSYEEGLDGQKKFASVLTSPVTWATGGGLAFVSLLGIVMRVLIVAARKY